MSAPNPNGTRGATPGGAINGMGNVNMFGAVGAYNGAALQPFNTRNMFGYTTWTPPAMPNGGAPPNPNGPRYTASEAIDAGIQDPETLSPDVRASDPVLEVEAIPEPAPAEGGGAGLSLVLWIGAAALAWSWWRSRRKGRA